MAVKPRAVEIDLDDPETLARFRRAENKRKQKIEAKVNGHAHDAVDLPTIEAYEPRPLEQIPRRQWLHAMHYIRQFMVMIVAPGGWGKSALVVLNAIEMALGKGLIGPPPPERLRVLLWNGEDPYDETERRIAAACLYHKVDRDELRGWLVVGHKIKGKQRLAWLDKNQNVVINQPVLDHIEAAIARHKIDVVIIDPLLPFHRVPESKNELMEEMLALTFSRIVEKYNCCVELSHHTRKSQGAGRGELGVDDSRGGGSVTNAARSVRVMNRMTKAEGDAADIPPNERRYYLRVNRDKPNLAKAGNATWIHLASQILPNGPGGTFAGGDDIQVAERWEYPSAFDEVTTADMMWMRAEVRRGAYRHDTRSSREPWVGKVLAEHLEIDVTEKAGRDRIFEILETWYREGVIATVERLDARRVKRKYVVPGNWAEPLAPDVEY